MPTLLRYTAKEISAALAAAIKEMYLQVLEIEAMRKVTQVNGNATTNQECQKKEPLEKIAAAV